ncbi:MAG TPA: hypothetical protein VE866_12715 [Candidatus Binatia bacterium]|nr:hypothetical protein [Candidatus Binatia bacterium]
MRGHRLEQSIPMIARLMIGLFIAITAVSLNAQPLDSEAQPSRAFGYDKAHEITLTGTIAAINEKPARGNPVGLHLVLSAPQGRVDAHLGPYMTKETIEALHTEIPVQVVGATEKLHGKEFLLARQVIFGGRLVQVRNENGFLVREHSAKSHHRNQKSGSKEGAR